ncbi:nuclease-related domain-containing protein [Catenulispora pinisilvae]|uniref:nuclease-related domain-containing protein n=1 Tax=Catenulispora pinisilvae TaxID=2705253 RepID=UPI001892198C|nr:nuclease-related domain-containing protein [Catenulispora pinisilvae]
MEGLTVQAWRKWGHDFLYVKDAAGQMLGCFDRNNGLLHVPDRSLRPAVVCALTPRLGDEFLSLGSPPPVGPSPEGSDLAGRAAGTGVAEQAARLSPGRVQRWVCRLLGLSTDATSWEVGARGERIVGRRLELLRRRGWEVLHSIPLASGADIDHLVIGPGGVFTVNTKHHARARIWVAGDRVMVNGRYQPYIRNSRHEAAAAARRLSAALGRAVEVRGVVAFVAPGSLTVREYPSDVLIATDGAIVRMLRRLPTVLSPDEVQAVFQVARRGEIWTRR